MPPYCYNFFQNIERTYSFVQYLINIVYYRFNLLVIVKYFIMNVSG